MGDSPITGTIENIAGRGVGMLAGLASLRGGGLLNYMMQRERLMNDPGFRAGLVGSPFTSGFFGIGGGVQPVAGPGGTMPAAGGVGQPPEAAPDFVGSPAPQPVAPPTPTAFSGPRHMP